MQSDGVSKLRLQAAKCSQVTPTSPGGQADIGTLFDPMVLPLAKMAVSGFTWYQGEANECPKALPVRDAGKCPGWGAVGFSGSVTPTFKSAATHVQGYHQRLAICSSHSLLLLQSRPSFFFS